MGFKNYILVCGGTGCESSRSDQIYHALIDEAQNQGVADQVQVIKTAIAVLTAKGQTEGAKGEK